MKHFLYLRIVTITMLVVTISYMGYIVYHWFSFMNWDRWYLFVANQVFLAVYLSHSLSILFIYQKFYPNKEIAKPAYIFYRIIYILGWVWTTFCILGILGVTIANTGRDMIPIIAGSIMIALSLLQLLGGKRMVKVIRRNARQQLENSFA